MPKISFAAKQFISDAKRVERNLRLLNKEAFGPRVLKGLANKARSIIYKRVKAGRGASGGKQIKLAALKPSTIQVRKGKGIIRTFKGRSVFIPGIDGRPDSVGDRFGAKKSNLTFSGQLLNSIDFNINGRGFTLFIPNTQRKPYKNHDVLNKKPPPTNEELAVYLQAGRGNPTNMQARPFFELTKGEERIIIKLYNDILKRIIRKRGF